MKVNDKMIIEGINIDSGDIHLNLKFLRLFQLRDIIVEEAFNTEDMTQFRSNFLFKLMLVNKVCDYPILIS